MGNYDRTVAAMRRAGERTGLEGDFAEHVAREWLELSRVLLQSVIEQGWDTYDGQVLSRGKPNSWPKGTHIADERIAHTTSAMHRAAEDELVRQATLPRRFAQLLREDRIDELRASVDLAELLGGGS